MLRLVFAAVISLFFFSNVCAQTSNDPLAQVQAQPQLQAPCSKTCIAESCDTIGIKYGKYCGIGYTGCPGEKPCDDVDACCQIHDDCVDVKGYTQVKCHKKFKKCIKAVQDSGKVGFSKDCPYDIAIPTMANGMDLAIMLSMFGNKEL